jgi:hypothetical protein
MQIEMNTESCFAIAVVSICFAIVLCTVAVQIDIKQYSHHPTPLQNVYVQLTNVVQSWRIGMP